MFVVSDQRLANLIAPITPFYSSQGEWFGFGDGNLTTYSEIYRTQPAVRSVVDFLAGHLARMPWKVMQKVNPTTDNHLVKHPSQTLLSDPSYWRANTNWWRDFWLDWLIYDRFASVNITDPTEGDIFQMIRIPPVWYTPFGPNYWKPQSLRIIGNRGLGDFDIDQCIYIHGYDPVDPRIGISPMDTMRTVLEEEASSQTWRRRFWDGNAQPSMVVTRPNDAPDWTESAKDRFVESLRNAANRGKPMLLEEGMTTDLNKNQFSPQSSQYIESKQFTREEVERFYGLPPGLFDAQGFSSVLQYRQYLYSEVLVSLLNRAADEFTSQLLTNWWPNPRSKGIRVVPGIEEAIRGSLSEQIAVLSPAVGVPFITREEARQFVNLPTDADDIGKIAVPVNYIVEGVGGTLADGSMPGGPTGAPGGMPANPPGGNGGAPTNPATALQGNNVGDNGKPEIGPVSPKAIATAQIKALTADKAQAFRDEHAKAIEKVLADNFERQRQSVKSSGKFNQDRWDAELAQDLFAPSLACTTAAGKNAAADFSGTYDEDRTKAYVTRNCEIAATRINSVARDQLKDKVPVDTVYDSAASRASSSAATRANALMNWGIIEAAKQNV
jgi:HK97 family phage portal protein